VPIPYIGENEGIPAKTQYNWHNSSLTIMNALQAKTLSYNAHHSLYDKLFGSLCHFQTLG
jgi:hypothetical protein